MSVATGSSVQMIVRVTLAPGRKWQAFEEWLSAMPPVLYAALVTGDADFEVRLGCSSFADLGDALTRICDYGGVHVASTALVLHEVPGLGSRREDADEVTMRRPGTM
jgi:Lrp/AsnC ligand binding domain